jgi:hypothetical protein
MKEFIKKVDDWVVWVSEDKNETVATASFGLFIIFATFIMILMTFVYPLNIPLFGTISASSFTCAVWFYFKKNVLISVMWWMTFILNFLFFLFLILR